MGETSIRRCSLREPPAVKHSSTSSRLQNVRGPTSLRFPNVRGLTSLRLQSVRGKKEQGVRGSIFSKLSANAGTAM